MNTIKIMAGEYTPEEAKEMLLETLNYNINYYKIKNLSSEVRFGKPSQEAHKRIEELNKAKAFLSAIIQQATLDKRMLKIESTVSCT